MICATEEDNLGRKDSNLKDLRNTEKKTTIFEDSNLKDLRNTGKGTRTSRDARKKLRKTGQENTVVRLKKNSARTTARRHTSS